MEESLFDLCTKIYIADTPISQSRYHSLISSAACDVGVSKMASCSSTFQARYPNGSDAAYDYVATPTIDILLQHQSIRSFLPDPLPGGTLETLIAAGQSASTSSMLHSWSVIAIQDPSHKEDIAKLCGDQDFIRQAPLFLVFCADLHRMDHLCKRYGQTGEALNNMDLFMQSTLDAALAAQNVTIAAESLSLGICYVGAARNNAQQMTQLLRVPHRSLILFGLAIGKAKPHDDAIKPRLPLNEVLHREYWSDDKMDENIANYDDALGAFYWEHHKHGRRTWSDHTSRWVSRNELDGREEYRKVVTAQGFGLE